MTFVPSNPLSSRLQHACGGEAEKQELINAIAHDVAAFIKAHSAYQTIVKACTNPPA